MPARDNIAGLVCGFPARLRKERCLVVLWGYGDDSADDDKGAYVLAGWLGTAENWESFSDDFEKAGLPHSLHMKTVRRLSGRRVRTLADLTLSRAAYRVDCVLHQGNYRNIIKGKIPLELDSPYFLLFYQVILSAARLADLVGWDGTIDWIFDEQGKIGTAANNWYWWIKERARPNLKRRLGSTPIFRDDTKVLPLKAADLFAWQIRRHIALEQPKGTQTNQILDSFLAKYGVSGQMTGPYLEDFVKSLNTGMLLKANCRFFLPKNKKSKSGGVF
jgi:hypothetical protein